MPTYEYACTKCGHQFEIVQSFSDDALTTCPECGGSLRKVFGSVGIVFKGSGFYKNDARGSSKSTTAAPPAATAESASASTTPSESSSSSSSTTSSTTPAASTTSE